MKIMALGLAADRLLARTGVLVRCSGSGQPSFWMIAYAAGLLSLVAVLLVFESRSAQAQTLTQTSAFCPAGFDLVNGFCFRNLGRRVQPSECPIGFGPAGLGCAGASSAASSISGLGSAVDVLSSQNSETTLDRI